VYNIKDNPLLKNKIMREYWKNIVGFEGRYQVSSKGRIKNLKRQVPCRGGKMRTVKERIRQPQIKARGYHIATLCDGVCTTTIQVHQLVAEAFIPGFVRGTEINHIDGNPGNNAVTNLEISAPSHNQLHARHVLGKGVKGKSSKYHNVSYVKNPRAKNKWAACIKHAGKSSFGWKTFATEEEAAKYVDQLLDEIGDTIRPRNFV
jgi:hypothetical protein